MTAEKFTNKFEGFVLAGGKSSRMGTDKAFLPFGKLTFLEHAFNSLLPVCADRVKIILNRNQPAEKISSYQYVRDVFEERGAPGGIHSGLSNSKSEWTIILACDLPLVESGTIRVLSETAMNTAPEMAAIVPVQTDGRIQPLCAFYRTALCLPQLENLLLSEASVSARDFLSSLPTLYLEIEKTPRLNESVFFNVNTPADFASLSKK